MLLLNTLSEITGNKFFEGWEWYTVTLNVYYSQGFEYFVVYGTDLWNLQTQ